MKNRGGRRLLDQWYVTGLSSDKVRVAALSSTHLKLADFFFVRLNLDWQMWLKGRGHDHNFSSTVYSCGEICHLPIVCIVAFNIKLTHSWIIRIRKRSVIIRGIRDFKCGLTRYRNYHPVFASELFPMAYVIIAPCMHIGKYFSYLSVRSAVYPPGPKCIPYIIQRDTPGRVKIDSASILNMALNYENTRNHLPKILIVGVSLMLLHNIHIYFLRWTVAAIASSCFAFLKRDARWRWTMVRSTMVRWCDGWCTMGRWTMVRCDDGRWCDGDGAMDDGAIHDGTMVRWMMHDGAMYDARWMKFKTMARWAMWWCTMGRWRFYYGKDDGRHRKIAIIFLRKWMRWSDGTDTVKRFTHLHRITPIAFYYM